MMSYFTSESVAAGHPDKICDQISDAIVDAALSVDPKARVAVETLVTTNRVVLAGEVTCKKKLYYEKIARGVIKSLGYTNGLYHFSHKSPISVYIHQQSPDIAVGVDDGGGCFSGKDPTKVDRSAAYAARYIAKNIVAAKLADRAEVRLAYVIGQREPLMKNIELFGTGKKPQATIEKLGWSLLDLSVKGIIEGLNLRRPIYRESARYGHFGRDGFPWEAIVMQ